MEKKKSRFTVLLVPSDNKHVRQFYLTYASVVLVPILIALLIIGFIYYTASTSEQIDELKTNITEKDSEIERIKSENILLQARVEELDSDLTQAQTKLEKKSEELQIETQTQAERTIPDAFPVAGGVGVPSAYTDETPFIQFTVGQNSRIVATADGVVKSIEDDVENAKEIVVDHGNGYVSTYVVKGIPAVAQGDEVKQLNALMISHSDDENENIVLTYKVEFNGVSIDPMTMIEVSG